MTVKQKQQKVLPVLENVFVTGTSAEGKALARVNDLVVFIENAVPGDVIDVKVLRKKKNFMEGRAIHFHEYSADRADPLCAHFGTCGGCKWQNLKYETQLSYKQKQVFDNLSRIGKITLPDILPIIPSKNKYYYRNKLEFTFSNKKWLTDEQIKSGESFAQRDALGFHIPGMFDKVLDIHLCHLQQDPSNAIRLAIKTYALENNLDFFDIREQQGFLRTLLIRTSSTGEIMVIVSFFYDDRDARDNLLHHIASKFPEITSLLYVINPKRNDTIADLDVHTFKGNDFIYEKMENLQFRIGPKSFYQTNSEQAHTLYQVTRNFAGLQASDTVYDLYTGTGTIANFVAANAAKVIGVDYVGAAIEDARINARINGITNTHFYAGDIKDVLNDTFIEMHGKAQVIITDPPRAGMHEAVVKKLLDIAADKIVYVSCNTATQARDLAILDEKYQVLKVQPVDMFPHTHHVECAILLELRG